jgi:hypothetical protein
MYASLRTLTYAWMSIEQGAKEVICMHVLFFLEQKNILMVHPWSTKQAFLFIITTRSTDMHVNLALHPDGRSSILYLLKKREIKKRRVGQKRRKGKHY